MCYEWAWTTLDRKSYLSSPAKPIQRVLNFENKRKYLLFKPSTLTSGVLKRQLSSNKTRH